MHRLTRFSYWGLGVLIAVSILTSYSYKAQANRCATLFDSLLLPLSDAQLLQSYGLPSEYRDWYYTRRVDPYLSRPHYKNIEEPDVLYRGMLLSPPQLRHILEHGLELKYVTWTAGGPGISFSSNLQEAKTYIFHASTHLPPGLGVVVKVKRSPDIQLVLDPNLNPSRTIFKTGQDVPANQILEVLILGPYGFEALTEVTQKIQTGRATPSRQWTQINDRR